MKLIKWLTGQTILFLLLSTLLYANPVVYAPKTINGIYVDQIVIDLNSPLVVIKPALAIFNHGKPNPAEPFKQFINRLYPTAAINGTFHDTRTYHLAGTVIINGKIKSFYPRGTAILISRNNKVSFLPAKLLPAYLPNDIDVITSGPTLIFHRKIQLYPKAEGFFDPSLFRPAYRSALGLTSHNKLILVTVRQPILLRQLAKIMLSLSCVYAASLDGGQSSGLYFNGKIITKPGRLLTNVLVVYRQKIQASYQLAEY